MNTIDKNAVALNEDTALPSIDTESLGDVTGGCGACGQPCANGPAPAAAGAPKLPALFAAVNAFSAR